jgi:hypothetical protein
LVLALVLPPTRERPETIDEAWQREKPINFLFSSVLPCLFAKEIEQWSCSL